MSFFDILGTLLIGPLKLLFEVIYGLISIFVEEPGICIIFMSLTVNILVLPLYRRADAMQEEARNTEQALSRGVDHIKKVFKGDEKMMILQTYYRQNGYKPTSSLKGSTSLLLQIPFFMAAYQFLSALGDLNGAAFGPISNLGAPDQLLRIGGLSVNVLPVLMTAINIVSCIIYSKGFPRKTKIQLYAMAAFFLVFLYDSPAGLVFYWTLNNLFSLIKTIFYKLKDPARIVKILSSLAGAALIVIAWSVFAEETIRRKLFLSALGLALQLPAFLSLIGPRTKTAEKSYKPDRKLFTVCGLFLAVLTGLLIPSNFIAASPLEFVDVNYYYSPVWYVIHSICMGVGTFLIWLRVFYWLAGDKVKVIFEHVIWVMSGAMLITYLFFGRELGVLSPSLQYERGMSFSVSEIVLNLVVIAFVAVIFILAARSKLRRFIVPALISAAVAVTAMSVINIGLINSATADISEGNVTDRSAYYTGPEFRLSTTGKNVVVIMLDRAFGEYIPYFMQEAPKLLAQYDGFTYYPNTISFGGHTNFAAPPLLGGYEYTPVEMNRRSSEPLKDKHNEALKVMPVIFNDSGFEVTVCDPPLAGYRWTPDLSIFDEWPEIDTYNTEGYFEDPGRKELVVEATSRNFFCFSLMKCAPVFLQTTFYNDGEYYHPATPTSQAAQSHTKANGLSSALMKAYTVLTNMDTMTDITDEDTDTFLFLSNNTTHEPNLVQEPDFVPSAEVDNSDYDSEHEERFTYEGQTLDMADVTHLKHYEVNMAALKRLGEWFDHLRESGAYDNTRIILTADHAMDLYQLENLIVREEGKSAVCTEYYYPLLMVKDFGATGFTTCEDFMTNADVPVLATDGLIEDPVNPFTGRPISSDEKYAHDQYITFSHEYQFEGIKSTTFPASWWGSVHDDRRDTANWKVFRGEYVLDEHTDAVD